MSIEVVLTLAGSLLAVLLSVVSFFLARVFTSIDNNTSALASLSEDVVQLSTKCETIENCLEELEDTLAELPRLRTDVEVLKVQVHTKLKNNGGSHIIDED